MTINICAGELKPENKKETIIIMKQSQNEQGLYGRIQSLTINNRAHIDSIWGKKNLNHTLLTRI